MTTAHSRRRAAPVNEQALRLAAHWRERTGKPVTVWYASEPVRAGQAVSARSPAAVGPVRGSDPVIAGTALHDAGPQQLVAVADGAGLAYTAPTREEEHACRVAYEALLPLSPAGRARALRWLAAALGVDLP
jgi:hypothetical protein